MSDPREPVYILRGEVVDDPLALYPVPGGMAEPVPLECPHGHRFGAGRVTVGWQACVAPGRNGHRTHCCNLCGGVILTPPADEHCTCADPEIRWNRPDAAGVEEDMELTPIPQYEPPAEEDPAAGDDVEAWQAWLEEEPRT